MINNLLANLSKKIIIFIYIILFSVCNSYAQDKQKNIPDYSKRKKIGLTLSGGGAKGIAHIGVLKALDSAGLKVDYITGSSMGAIVGGLYSIGYTGKEIEHIALNMRWDDALSSKIDYQNVVYEEKEEFEKYALEVPIVKRRFKIETGMLEGQELWLILAELFYPVLDQRDFSKFPIPFKCIATDVATGEAVAISNGDIVNAIRASMAIPGVFTAVDYDGRKFIDGGVVRNFPVNEVKDMGAEFVIGINVGQGLLKADQINSLMDVVYQIGAYKEYEDFVQQKQMCDIFIAPDLTGYSSSDFDQADDIFAKGDSVAKVYYPIFKKMADSINNMYSLEYTQRESTVDTNMTIKIDTIVINGLHNTSKGFVKGKIGISSNSYKHKSLKDTVFEYTSKDINEGMRFLYGTRRYKKVSYSIDSIADSDGKKMTVNVTEAYPTIAKVAVNYNSLNNVSAILNLTARDLLLKNTKALLTLGLGKDFRARGELYSYIGENRKWGLGLSAEYINNDLYLYDDFKKSTLYRYSNFRADIKTYYALNRYNGLSFGVRSDITSYTPSFDGYDKAGNKLATIYLGYDLNTLDRKYFPTSGRMVTSNLGYIIYQDPIYYNLNPNNGSYNPINLNDSRYFSLILKITEYYQLTKKSSFYWNTQLGLNFNKDASALNNFNIGGVTENGMNNQIQFYGLMDNGYYSSSISTFLIGYQFEFYKKLFLNACYNVGYADFLSDKTGSFDQIANGQLLGGGSLAAGYNSPLGPIQFTLMRSFQEKELNFYVNLGFSF